MAEKAVQSPGESSPNPADSIEVDEDIKEEETGEPTGRLPRELYKEMRAICDLLTNHRIAIKGDEDYYPSALFRRIPNKRNLPEYHTIIQEPRAISTLKHKIVTKKYRTFAEYVRDFALIVHNAQVFNRPKSGPVKDVLVLKSVFEEGLKHLVERGLITKEDTSFPDLGEIPDATPEAEMVTEDEEEEDDEDDEEADDSDDEGKGKKGRRRAGRISMAGRKRDRSEDGQKGGDADARKRRGRPPRVDTPMEARIKAVLKGIRKFKSGAGHLKVLPFERLPDKAQNPGYYLEITEPIAVDLIKRKVKRKKYQSLEHFMRDMELMFSNAMKYNEDESDIYKDAKELWEEAKNIAEAERQKPDTEYLMEDGRLPLPNGILHNNELWKVGDWVHIQNPNDVTKPIVAQIYRTWQDTDGQQWVNACWYYRPEQTVHQYEKHFYPNEVVKTGQYRDHHIDEIVDRCFVMFFTRYNRGRPRGLDPSKEVYVCEARYNEEKHRLNKIKTWASCLPDEVREKDYEMDMFDAPKKIKKIPSPIKHLLKDDAKETDELPVPQWGRENAPPIVGGVHRQPRDENQSPPPEPTPPPPPTHPAAAPQQPSNSILARQTSRPNIEALRESMMVNIPRRASSTTHSIPQMIPGSAYHQTSASPVLGLGRANPYQQPQTPYGVSGIPSTPSQPTKYVQQPQATPSASHPSSYNPASSGQTFSSRIPPVNQHVPATQSHHQSSSQHHNQASQRHPEVYVMSEAANASIPLETRQQFPCDDRGRVLWFTTPPLHNVPSPKDVVVPGNAKPLVHTPEYLAAKAKRVELMEERKRQVQERTSGDAEKRKRAKNGEAEYEYVSHGEAEVGGGGGGGNDNADEASNLPKRRKPLSTNTTNAQLDIQILQNLTDQILNANQQWYRSQYGDDRAAEIEAYDALRAGERKREQEARKAYFEEREKRNEERLLRERELQGAVFADDWDERH